MEMVPNINGQFLDCFMDIVIKISTTNYIVVIFLKIQIGLDHFPNTFGWPSSTLEKTLYEHIYGRMGLLPEELCHFSHL